MRGPVIWKFIHNDIFLRVNAVNLIGLKCLTTRWIFGTEEFSSAANTWPSVPFIYVLDFGGVGGEDEECWPWANICCPSSHFCLRKIVPVLIFHCFVCGMPPQHDLMSGVWVCTQDPNLQTLGHQSRVRKLNHYATRLAPSRILIATQTDKIFYDLTKGARGIPIGECEGRSSYKIQKVYSQRLV